MQKRNIAESCRTSIPYAKQPLSLSPNHLPQRLAINGSLKPKAQNFDCALRAQVLPCAAIKLSNMILS
jgi:hypothetical protein